MAAGFGTLGGLVPYAQRGSVRARPGPASTVLRCAAILRADLGVSLRIAI